MVIRSIILVGFVLLEGFLVYMQLPMLRGHVARNHRYGLRTRETLADDTVWYAANRRSAQQGIASAAVECLAAIALFAYTDVSNWHYLWLLFALVMGSQVVLLLRGMHLARKTARDVQSMGRPDEDTPRGSR